MSTNCQDVLNSRDIVSAIVLIVALCSFSALVSLPVQVATTLVTVGITLSPYTTVADTVYLTLEPYTQRTTTSEFVPAFQADQNSISIALLSTLLIALMVLTAILLTGYRPKSGQT